MNAHEVFHTALAGVIKQGKPALRDIDSSRCVYRTHDGLKCAVGMLIPDGAYRPEMEEHGPYSLPFRFPALAHLKSQVSLLAELQSAHDEACAAARRGQASFLTGFCFRMGAVAGKYGISIEPPPPAPPAPEPEPEPEEAMA